jgi:hydrogenase maturation protein HypF
MCDDCYAEYADPLNRRFHAQPLACPHCGPFVELRETHSLFPTSDPRISSIEFRTSAILKARRLLREGYIVAVKGLGGFHLACDASNPYTLAELRERKGRIDKPFAVMAANITAIASVCNIQKEEHLLLTSREKPIVLLTRRKQTGSLTYKVSELVAPNLDTVGVMLPYTPLHHLLLNQTDPVLAREPVPPILVMTSSNFREEPIAINNKEALEKLSPLADAFLLHNRDIHIRCDDSIVKLDDNHIVFVRLWLCPIQLHSKSSLSGCRRSQEHLLPDRDRCISDHHIGDMENVETRKSLRQGINIFHMFSVKPEIITHDLHPDYFTTICLSFPTDIQSIGVQHHHAYRHRMADNDYDGA